MFMRVILKIVWCWDSIENGLKCKVLFSYLKNGWK